MTDIKERLGEHGFTLEHTGGGCTAWTRYDGEMVEMITLNDAPQAPWKLSDNVAIGTYAEDVEDLGDEVTLRGYTLADVLAALENPSDEYFLLELRLHNGLHK